MVATKIITNKFENHLLSIKAEHQKQIRPNLHHPIYNERHEKIIELIEWTLEKYKEATVANIKKNQQNGEHDSANNGNSSGAAFRDRPPLFGCTLHGSGGKFSCAFVSLKKEKRAQRNYCEDNRLGYCEAGVTALPRGVDFKREHAHAATE